jgi:mannosyltransferase OCH1-like enzyme
VIPPILVRTVPEKTTTQVEQWWLRACQIHKNWATVTFRDPINPASFPRTSPHWRHCQSGAQLAGLVRLEAIWNHGGIYLDSDVEVFCSFDTLRDVPMFAAWEDEAVVPDAIFGAEPKHPAVDEMIDEALARLYSKSKDWRAGNGAWSTGPGVFTSILPGRSDVLLLPPQSFYAVHYTQKDQLDRPPGPYEFARHHWHASWLPNQGSGA